MIQAGRGYGRDDHCHVRFGGSNRERDGPFGTNIAAADESGVLAGEEKKRQMGEAMLSVTPLAIRRQD
jgi:hypothetical protein